jgi:hypothetical protein
MANNFFNKNTSIPISITAPGLKNPNYGENIDDQFRNIDANFKHIVGTDFLKGNDGVSAYASSIKLVENDNNLLGLFLNGVDQTKHSIYTQIKNAIYNKTRNKHSFVENKYNEDVAFDSVTNNKGEEINWFDNLIEAEIVIFYELNSRGERHIISILPFNFLDARFCNINYNNIPDINDLNPLKQNPYETIYDMSGTILLERNSYNQLEFNISENMPTLYYNENVNDSNDKKGTFCWRINGHETGIPATGPRGDVGKTSKIYFVAINSDPDLSNPESVAVETPSWDDSGITPHLIKYIYAIENTEEGPEIVKEAIDIFISSDKFEKDYVKSFGNNSMAIVVDEVPYGDTEKKQRMWISPIMYNNDGYYVICTDANRLDVSFTTQTFKNMLYSIGNEKLAAIPGVIVPIDYKEKDGKLKGHMLYNLNENSINTLYIAPVKNTTKYAKLPTHSNSIVENSEISDEKSALKFLYDDVHVDGNARFGGELAGNSLVIDDSALCNGDLKIIRGCEIGGDLTVGGSFILPDLPAIKIGPSLKDEPITPIDELIKSIKDVETSYAVYSDWMKTIINRNLIIGNQKNLNDACDVRAYVNDMEVYLCDKNGEIIPHISISSDYANIKDFDSPSQTEESSTKMPYAKLSILNSTEKINEDRKTFGKGLILKYEYLVNSNDQNVDIESAQWNKKTVSINLSQLFESDKFKNFAEDLKNCISISSGGDY